MKFDGVEIASVYLSTDRLKPLIIEGGEETGVTRDHHHPALFR